MVSIVPLSRRRGILNLMTVLHALIRFKYSLGMSVLEAARSKKSLTCSRKRGSWKESSLGPKLVGSMLAVLEKRAASTNNKGKQYVPVEVGY